MSHISEIKVQITDMACLRKAAKNLGLEFREGQKNYRWYGRSVGNTPLPKGFNVSDLGKCDHAIAVPGNSKAYELGVIERDGKIHLHMDEFAGGYGLVDKIGRGAQKLTMEYEIEVAQKAAINDGYSVTRYNRPDGRVYLEVQR